MSLHRVAATLLVIATTAPAFAFDASWSGFATLGYARSNSAYTYQRSIDDGGTLRRDSRVAGQLDLSFDPQWSATVQAQVAQSDNSDTRWAAKAAWAFVAWRPDNDWQLRLGKARVPLYLYSESLDVGVSYDMARMPYEVYSLSPTNDFTGLFVTRSFARGNGDLSVDAYAGTATAQQRMYLRDGVPPRQPGGALFVAADVRIAGLVLTAREPHLTWRLGVHSATSRRGDGSAIPVRFPRVDLGPGLYYWQVESSLPGPGVPTVERLHNLIGTAGVEWNFGDGWRFAGEFTRVVQRDIEIGSDSSAAYLALFKRIGDFTPYVSVARQRSSQGTIGWRTELVNHALPPAIPGAAMINAAQRVHGETVYAADQGSFALGFSWAWSPKAKVKAEWMRTHVGATSAHFDPPPGMPDAQGMNVNTLSLSVNVAF